MPSGVALSSLKPGLNVVQTLPDGPSNSNDYEYPVSLDNKNPLPPNTVIPPGTTLYIAVYPEVRRGSGWASSAPAASTPGGSPTAVNVATGTQIPLDAAQIQAYEAQAAAAWAAIKQAERQHTLAVANAERQHALDVARFGREVADANFQQAYTRATFQLQQAQQQLGADSLNFQQRQSVAQGKTNILQMLADRRGPQDWVAYNNLLNGLNAPNPNKSTTLDPFSILDGLNVPTTANGAGVQPPPLERVQGYTPPPAASAQQAPVFDPSPANRSAPIAARPATPLPASNPWGTRPPTPQARPLGYANAPGSDPNINSTASNAAYTSAGNSMYWDSATQGWKYWDGKAVPQMANGGMTMDAAIVGDPKPGSDRPNPEMVVSPTGAPVMVIPLDGAMPQSMPRMAGGGQIGSYGADTTNRMTFNTYDSSTLGSQPFYEKLTGRRAAPAFGGFGASLDNPALGIRNAPWAINLQRFNMLAPSEQQMTQSLYEQGLWTDFGDQMEQARRAAPAGYAMGATRYGG